MYRLKTDKLFRRQNQGITLIELMIAMSILGVITSIAISMIFSTHKNQNFISVQTNLKNASESFSYRLARELSQAIKIFDETEVGASYRNNLDMLNQPASMSVVRLATIRDQGVQSPSITCDVDDSAFFWAPSVGNTLFFAELIEQIAFPALPAEKQRTINVYRFNYYYINQPAAGDSSQPVIDFNSKTGGSSLKAQRLIKWKSVKYADYDQLNDYLTDPDFFNDGTNVTLTGSEKTTVTSELASQDIELAWDRDFGATSTTYHQAFYAIGSGTQTQKSAAYKIEHALTENALRLKSDNQGIYSIAYNKKLSPANNQYYFPLREKVPYLYNHNPTPTCSGENPQPATGGLPNAADGLFPRGFEVMITGPSTGRSVLLRLTAVGKSSGQTISEYTLMKSFFAKDL